MAIIPIGMADTIITRMVTELQAFSAEQVLLDANVGFNVKRDQVRPPVMKDMPLANIWLQSLDPQGFSGKRIEQELARIAVDCYAKGLDGDVDTIDDTSAMSRLYYFAEQVKYGLYRLINSDFGLPVGSISRKRWPSWQLFQNDLKLPENEVVAGRWIIEIEYQWTPEDITGTILDRIAVDAVKWSGLYTYGGD